MTAKHIVNIGLVVAQVNNSAAIDRFIVCVPAEEEYLSASLANSEIRTKIHKIVLDGSKARLQFGAKT